MREVRDLLERHARVCNERLVEARRLVRIGQDGPVLVQLMRRARHLLHEMERAAARDDVLRQSPRARLGCGLLMLILINLDSALERRNFMASQLFSIGAAFTRVGVDMRRQPRQFIADWVDAGISRSSLSTRIC